jgi:hypothetical protein
VLPTQTRANDLIPYDQGNSRNQPELPVEIWAEISQWLPRSDLKTLLYVPHPLRVSASELYFREIVVEFYVCPTLFMASHLGLAQPVARNTQKSLEILLRILKDAPFARRVKTFKIFMNDSKVASDLCFEMGKHSSSLHAS